MEQSLFILDELIHRKRNKKTKRLIHLLADFSQGYANNWGFCVPLFFYEALDIRFTERVIERKKTKIFTQESYFNFSIGDTFYNHPYPYCNNFKCSFISSRKLCLQIESVHPCTPQFEDIPRNPGQVNFKVLEFKDNWHLIAQQNLSQDDFLKLLIQGLK